MAQHSLSYKAGNVDVDGVAAVESFDQKCVLLRLEGGLLEIRGSNFVLKDMTSDSGKVSFSGKIRSLEYKEKLEPKSVLQKLFR
ncbi:MAG: hypothetical protein J5781_07210 [Clostridia bacterium]|nr:hypothetical protein [Clostridia bacterium]